jgi:acyl carrier protein phosphodiesterase
MNFLAHAYLSFQQPQIVVGNMISDYIKGKKQFDYPVPIQKGIRLHRAIDQFTDTHAATQKLKSFFRPQYRLYSGAFADVVYDYFLANDQNEFTSPEQLKRFSSATYQVIDDHFPLLPVNFQKLFPYMKAQDWLFNYREKWLIEKSFWGLERRAVYLKETGAAFTIFNKHIVAMHDCYAEFFPSLKKYATHHLDELLHT